MSNKKHRRARLPGYEGPLYPVETDALGAAVDDLQEAGCQALYDHLCKPMEGFEEQWRLATSDGYEWFSLLVFNREGCLIVIALPWAQDWPKTDGTQRDRSVAAYVSERAGRVWVKGLLEEVTAVLRRHARTTI